MNFGVKGWRSNDPGVCEGQSETDWEQRNVSFVNAMFCEAAFTGFHIPAWIVRTKRRGMGALKKRNHPHGFELSRFVRTPEIAEVGCEGMRYECWEQLTR